MGILEKNLPIAESISEGDMLRMISSDGESKQISADAIGGGEESEVFVVKITYEDYTTATADKTADEILDAFNSGKSIVGVLETKSYDVVTDISVFDSVSLVRMSPQAPISGWSFKQYSLGVSTYGQAHAYLTIRTFKLSDDDSVTITEQPVMWDVTVMGN